MIQLSESECARLRAVARAAEAWADDLGSAKREVLLETKRPTFRAEAALLRAVMAYRGEKVEANDG